MAKINMNFFIMIICIVVKENVVTESIDSNNSTLYRMIYHEVKPYIFENEHGEVTGIIPDVYKMLGSLCLKMIGKSKMMEYVKKVSSRKQLLDIYYNESIRYGEGELENMTAATAVWGPIVAAESIPHLESRQVHQFSIFSTQNMAVITKRYRIGLIEKLVLALKTGMGIFCMTGLFVIISGLVFWLLERADNPLISHISFAQSLFNSIWWSFITMATVGYGDFVPHTRLGRIWSVFWMYLALVATCIMTANITSVIYGVGDYALDGKRVSVLSDSFEGITAAHTYHTENIEYETLKEALEAVENEDVFAALINEQIVAWNVDMLSNIGDEPLVVINVLPVNIVMSALFSEGEATAKFSNCIQPFYGLVERIFARYDKKLHVEVVHFNALETLFMIHSSPIFPTLLILICLFFMSGVIYDVVKKNVSINGFKTNIGGRLYQNGANSRVRQDLQQLRDEISKKMKVTNFST